MSDRRLEIEFIQKLEPFFEENGFEWLRDKNQFRKNMVTGFQNIIFSMTVYDNEKIVEIHFGVRSEMIEKMVQQFLINSESYKKDANTVITNIGNYRNNPYFRYKVRSNEDAKQAINDIKDFFTKDGFDFMDKIADINTLDEILNFDPQRKNKFIYNQVHRCFKGIASAKINDRGHFHGLIDIYRTYLLKNASDLELLHFERLVSYLLHFSAN